MSFPPRSPTARDRGHPQCGLDGLSRPGPPASSLPSAFADNYLPLPHNGNESKCGGAFAREATPPPPPPFFPKIMKQNMLGLISVNKWRKFGYRVFGCAMDYSRLTNR